jgi:hypothetical protein
LLVFHAYINEMHDLRSKIPSKNLVRQRCMEEFDSGVKGLVISYAHVDVSFCDGDTQTHTHTHTHTHRLTDTQTHYILATCNIRYAPDLITYICICIL